MLCEDNYYLKNKKECVERKVQDANCDIYNYFEDKCKICKDNYILNTIKGKCYPAIKNCLDYNSTDNSV